jgi:hypothetical protein
MRGECQRGRDIGGPRELRIADCGLGFEEEIFEISEVWARRAGRRSLSKRIRVNPTVLVKWGLPVSCGVEIEGVVIHEDAGGQE